MMLPGEVRAELEKMIVAHSYGNYRHLVEWLKDAHGVDLSASTICRHGQQLERRLESLRLVTEQAKSIVSAAPDESGQLNDALIRLVQEKAFAMLIEIQAADGKIDLEKAAKVVAQLSRASVAQKKLEKDFRQEVKDAAASVEEQARSSGSSKEQAAKLRQLVLGIGADD